MRPEVLVEVDELILEGLSPEEGVQLRQAMERELQVLLGESGSLPASGAVHIPQLDAGTLPGSGPARAEALGVQIGSGLHRALRGGRS